MPESNDDRGEKPQYICKNIRSGFTTCGSTDVDVCGGKKKNKEKRGKFGK